jgi:hypothetical protein
MKQQKPLTEKYVDDPYKGDLSDEEVREYNILKELYYLEVVKGKTNDVFTTWILKNKKRLSTAIDDMRSLKGKKMNEEQIKKTTNLAKYLDDMMTTSSIGLSPSNYVGTMKKFNRKTGKAEHVGIEKEGQGFTLTTKNADGTYQKGKPPKDPKTIVNKKPYVDPLITMRANLKKAKKQGGGIFSLQSRNILL